MMSDPLESQFGISDRALAWLKSYLLVRTLCISYRDITSIFTYGKYGIPQGSVLGPLHFSLCICHGQSKDITEALHGLIAENHH